MKGSKNRVLALLALLTVVGLAPSAARAGAASTGPQSWGNNSSGQLGNGTSGGVSASPGPILLAGQVAAYSAGNQSSYALTADGTVWAWGDDSSGELGPDGAGMADSAKPVAVTGLCSTCGAVVQLASGENNAFALFADGSIEGWGKGTSGALGDGKTASTAQPQTVRLGGTHVAVAVAAGGQHGVALMSDGTVEAWGQGRDGQLGNGATANSKVPVQVSGITNAVAVSAANLYSLALLSDGTVVAWGYNAFGQLGDGTTVNRSVPVRVVGLAQPATSISAGGNLSSNGHSMAVLADGTVATWGCNANGELGDGTLTNSSVPVAAQGVSGAAVVSAGGRYSTVLLSDGAVEVWGTGRQGELGNGKLTKVSPAPAPVPGLGGVTLLSAGPPGQILVG